DRLGVEEMTLTIIDVALPKLKIPVRPGRNMTSIIEVAARNQLLKVQGHHSAKEFQDRLNRAIAEARPREYVPDEGEQLRIVLSPGVSRSGERHAGPGPWRHDCV